MCHFGDKHFFIALGPVTIRRTRHHLSVEFMMTRIRYTHRLRSFRIPTEKHRCIFWVRCGWWSWWAYTCVHSFVCSFVRLIIILLSLLSIKIYQFYVLALTRHPIQRIDFEPLRIPMPLNLLHEGHLHVCWLRPRPRPHSRHG